jgi:peptidoglycan hydrolase CwlO-like protein
LQKKRKASKKTQQFIFYPLRLQAEGILTVPRQNAKIMVMERQKQKTILLTFLVSSTLVFCLFFQKNTILAQDNQADDKLQKSIEDIQNKLQQEQKDKQKIVQELNQIQTSVNKTQYEISKTQSLISETEATISRKEEEVKLLGEKVNLQKILLASLIREIYYFENSPVEVFVLSNEKFSQFLVGADRMMEVQEKITNTMKDIEVSRKKIDEEVNNLKDTREEHQHLLAMKEDQSQSLLAEKSQTQGDLQEKEATIAELQAKISELRQNVSGYLGKAYNAKDIEDAAGFASKAAGVRRDFLMGMLVVESDLGRYTGGCYAKDSRMSGNRLTLFKGICSDLHYDWKSRKVSCPPKSYVGTGGAMGVGQFMSDTWVGYKSSIASKTGHNPPDPWNLTDGVMAMGLKLARGGATSKSGECNAAKLYLSGTTSSKYNWYCQKVLYWADNYERLLN